MWVTKERLERSRNALWNGYAFHHESWYTNCAGYAFGTGGWYDPAKNEDDAWRSYHQANHHGWRDLERKYVKRILHDFSGWVLTDKRKISEGNEYVAFRIRRDAWFCDFHFMKYDGTKWTQKCGHCEVDQEWFKLEDIFESEAWGEYDGRLFVFKKAV